MLIKEIISHSPEETEAIAYEFASLLKESDIVGLIGQLGAGKTVFVKGLAKGLEVGNHVRSPSYIWMHIYSGKRFVLHHLDFYRLTDETLISELGLEESIFHKGITVIEWIEKVNELVKEANYIIYIDPVNNENSRRIKIIKNEI